MRDGAENTYYEVILWSDIAVDHKIMFKFSRILCNLKIMNA